MPVQPMTFRKLEVEDVSPFHNALQEGIQNYINMTNARYLPKQMAADLESKKADVLSKAAYATYTPYGYISKALSDPMIMGSLAQDPESLKRITSMLSNIPTDPMQSLNNSFNEPEQDSFGSLWDSVKKAISRKGNQIDNTPLYNQNMSQSGNPILNESYSNLNDGYANLSNIDKKNIDAMQPGDAYVIGSGQKPTQVPYSYDYVLGSGKRSENIPSSMDNHSINLSDPRMNSFNKDFGSPEANIAAAIKYPSPNQKNIIESSKAANVESAKKTTDIKLQGMDNLEQEANTQVNNAYELSQEAEKFKSAYDQASIKGRWANLPFGEKAASFDPDAREAMTSANKMAVKMASMLFGNRQSDYREKLAQTLKLSITMPQKTVNNIMEGIRAESKRIEEYYDFIQEAKNLGIKNPNDIKNMWFHYNKEKPFFDIKNRKVLNENLNTYSTFLKGNVVEDNGKVYFKRNGRWYEQ